MPADLVTVTGTVTDAARVPVRGRVGLRPLAAAVDTTTPQALITDNTVSVGLDDTGAFTLHVTASDDSGWRTTGPVPYLVSLETLGRPRRAWTVMIPGPGPYDLWDLVALDEPPGVVTVPVAGDHGLLADTVRRLDDLIDDVSDIDHVANGALPVDPMNNLVGSWSPTHAYKRGDLVQVTSGGHVDYFTSDRDQTGGQPPSRTNTATWTMLSAVAMLHNPDQFFRPLDHLADVTAPAATPAGKVLGTTGTGAWEPVTGLLAEEFGDPTLLTQTHPAHDLVHWLVWLEGRITALETAGGGSPTVPTAEGTLEVDMYSGSFVRARDTGGVLADGQPHWIDFALATEAGPGGAVIDKATGVPAGSSKTWYDRGGQLGGIVGPTGTDVNQTTMRNWVKYGRDAAAGQAHYVLLAHVDTTVEPGHPRLVISNIVTIG